MPFKKKMSPAGSPGKARKYLMDSFNLPADACEYSLCQNGHVLRLYFDNNSSAAKTVRSICDRFGIKPTINQVRTLVNRTRSLLPLLSRESVRRRFEGICRENFILQSPRRLAAAPDPESESVIESVAPTSVTQSSVPEAPVSTSPQCSVQPALTSPRLEVPLVANCSDPGVSCSSSRVQLSQPSSHETTPEKEVLTTKKGLSFLSKANAAGIEAKHREGSGHVRRKARLAPYKVKRLQQMVRRKENIIRGLRQALSKMKSRKYLCKILAKLRRLKKHRKDTKRKYMVELAYVTATHRTDLENALKEKHEQIRKLKDENVILQGKINDMRTARAQEQPSEEEKIVPSSKVRLLILDCVANQVPIPNIPVLIQKLAKRLGFQLAWVPDQNTVEEIARELGG